MAAGSRLVDHQLLALGSTSRLMHLVDYTSFPVSIEKRRVKPEAETRRQPTKTTSVEPNFAASKLIVGLIWMLDLCLL